MLIRLIFTLALCFLSFAPCLAQKQLTILHTNDTHSCILPLNEHLADTTVAGRGGFVRRIALLREERAKDPELLYIDSGDFSQGSSYYTMFEGDVEIGLMNQMGIDAATIGNHEFDFGLENMERLFRMATFPIVCSNYDFADTGLKDVVKPYVTLRRRGVKIGIFAVCPPLEGLVFTKNYGPLRFLDPGVVAQKMVDVLRNEEKCDLVICVSHLGWQKTEYPDEKMIEQTSGIDLVLGGHSHTYLKELAYAPDRDGRPVAVDQNGKHGAFIGKLVLDLDEHATRPEIELRAEAQLSASDGSTPLWLNANKYGLSSLDKTNGYLRLGAFRHIEADSARRWAWGAGADVAVAGGYTSTLVVHQAYAQLRWLKGLLTVGSKEQPLQLKDQRLSSGSQTLGINARPVPSVRIEMPDYWDIPGLRHWLGVKGHLAYGLTTDTRWQKDFTSMRSSYSENVSLHTKAGYLRIGPSHKPLTAELGVEMGCQYGGTTHQMERGVEKVLDNEGGLKGMWHALIPGGEESVERDIVYKNTSGNHVGSYVARINYDQPAWGVSVYADHFFDDQSQMFFFSNNSYGQNGRGWNEKGDRYLTYALRDMMLGLELRVRGCPWIEKFVAEYMYTKHQSGPIYHDRSERLLDHIVGIDNYYNHGVYGAWQHWGQVMGNPLYRSPLYNDGGQIAVLDNRFKALHFAATGTPLAGLRYRLMCTIQRGWGTYREPLPDPQRNVSLMAEAAYTFQQKEGLLKGCSVKGAFGMDRGRLLGDNTGFQLTVAKAMNL